MTVFPQYETLVTFTRGADEELSVTITSAVDVDLLGFAEFVALYKEQLLLANRGYGWKLLERGPSALSNRFIADAELLEPIQL